ncbi:MAG: hypothetical protein LBQ60_12780 [Bacteroidales bacterium]|jgi:O-antigen/teichoic acid export membrane protein|nr:hypothetical protein [Bacteroidales bacterium]
MFKQPTSASQRVALNTGILYAKMGITMFISLFTTRLVINSLGASDFGIFDIVGGVISMLGFLNVAMASATQRFMSYAEGEGDKEKQKSIFNVSVVLHFFIALLIGLILLVAGYFFFNGVLNIPPERIFAAKIVYLFMVVSTLFTIMTVPYEAVLNAHENMLYYAIIGIIESVLKLTVAIIVVFTMSDKLIVYGALMACISFLVMLIMRIYCHKNYAECVFKPRKFFHKELMKEMTGFAGWNFTVTSVSLLTNYGQGIVLNMFFGPIINAAQGLANQICGQLGVFANTMLKALNPVIAKNEGRGSRSSMLSASMTGSKIAFFMLMFFFVPVYVEMPYVLKIWLKNVPEYTVIFCKLLFIRFLIEQLYITIESSIAAVGKIRNFSIWQSLLTLFILPVGYLFYKYGFPPYALHLIFIVAAIISLFITVFFAHKVCEMSVTEYFTRVLLRCIIPLIVTAIAASLPLLFMESGFARLCVVVLFSSVAFLGIVWVYGLNRMEREQISQMLVIVISKIKVIRKS